MRDFVIFTDSTSDLTDEDLKRYNIQYLHMSFYLDGKIFDGSLSWKDISPDEFFSKMNEKQKLFTGQVSYNEIMSKFEPVLKEKKDILYIGCSSALSGSINAVRLVHSELIDQYKEFKIIIIDSLRTNYAQGMMAIDASKMKEEGKSIDDIANTLIQNKLKYQTFSFSHTLFFMTKTGRIRIMQKFKDLLGYKFLIRSDSEGSNEVFKAVKLSKNGLLSLVDIIMERIDAIKNDLYIEYGDNLKETRLLVSYLKDRGFKGEIHISRIGPIVGASTGPKSINVSFFGKKTSVLL